MASADDVDLVVTGASGYVGSYLLRSAARRGYRTKGIVRAPVPWLEPDLQRVAPLLSDSEPVMEGADAVVHLAAPNETAFRNDPEEALAQTVDASRSVAQVCARTGVRRLFYISTVHVYGSAMKPGASITEETPAVPVGGYGRSRLISERVMWDEASGVQVVIFRLTNGVGAPVSASVERWTLVANDLCRQAGATGRMRVAQPGQWRDFIPLDAVASLILEASKPAHEALVPPGIYNLSAGRSITILDLAGLIADEAKRLGIPASIDAPTASFEPSYRIDNAKIGDTGLLPGDLSLSRAIRDTLQLCVGDQPASGASSPLAN